MTAIGNHAFSACSSLENVEIPNSVTSIEKYVFEGCEALRYNEYDNGLYLGNKENPYAFLIKIKSTDMISCTIKETCKCIGERAFEGCWALTNLHIRYEHPEELKIHEDAFRNSNIKNCTLYVPKWTENAYGQHPAFCKFKKIKVKHDNFIESIMYLIGKYI